MVECKFCCNVIKISAGWRFNKYMVECKSILLLSHFDSITVLIDTWWNVNSFNPLSYNERANVLIDTWWNVNYSYYEAVGNVDGF